MAAATRETVACAADLATEKHTLTSHTSRNTPHPKGSITTTIISHCLMWLSTPKHSAENSDPFQTLSSHFRKVALQFLCNYSGKKKKKQHPIIFSLSHATCWLSAAKQQAEFPDWPKWDCSVESWHGVWECQAKQANSLSKQAFLNLSHEAEQTCGQRHSYERKICRTPVLKPALYFGSSIAVKMNTLKKSPH